MFRKMLLTGGAALLTVSAFGATFGLPAFAQEQSRAPVPTTPTSATGGTSSTLFTGTATTQPPIVERSSQDPGVANTGPHDYVAWLSLAGVVSVALGVSMRGRRADGEHWRR